MHTDNKKDNLRSRYKRLRAAGFPAKEADKLKWWKESRVKNIIERKERYDRLLPFVIDKDEAWRLAGSYSTDQVNEMIMNILKEEKGNGYE